MSEVVGLPNNSYKPINIARVGARLCKLQKGFTRLSAASDKVYQLLAQGQWFSPGTPASSTSKTGRHDIAEILLKVASNTKNQSNHLSHSTIFQEYAKFCCSCNGVWIEFCFPQQRVWIRMSLVKQELLILLNHTISHPVLVGSVLFNL